MQTVLIELNKSRVLLIKTDLYNCISLRAAKTFFTI